MNATTTPGVVTDPLLQSLGQARARTDEVFRIVRPEAIYDRPIPERHRIIFYVGHLEAFDWNLLNPLLELKSSTPGLDQLFAFGIDPLGGGLPTDQPSDWPRPDETAHYNRQVRGTLDRQLAAFDEAGTRRRELRQLFHVAIEHRLMHAETLAYMLHQLPLHRKYRPRETAFRPSPAEPPITPRMAEIPEGEATLGLVRSEDGPFGWDNEFEEHSVKVPAFSIGAYPVTNREFLRFVEEGGYQERSLWCHADWQWLEKSGTSQPAFWARRGSQWVCRTMFDEVPLPADWPVSVSHAEASAYAHWAGLELPSEAEWHRAAYGTPEGTERDFPWGNEPPDPSPNGTQGRVQKDIQELARGNFNFSHWGNTAVGDFPAGRSAFGLSDLAGNGWEWTSTPFAPFEGFQAFPFYPGYSANFFDGQHYVMKGGSARTAASMLRRSFRNWFQPHYPYVYSAFRCVQH